MELKKYITNINPDLSRLTLDPDELKRRLLRRLSLAELFALGFALAMIGVTIWLDHMDRVVLYDFKIFLNTANGVYDGYYYPYWINPLFSLLSNFPFYAAYVIWMLINLAGIFFASRIFGSVPALVLLSYQMLYSIYFGQITGLVAAGMGLIWVGMANKKWWLAGMGLLLAAVKIQSGLMFAILLILFAQISWKDRGKILIIPIVMFFISVIAYPFWPIDRLMYLIASPANSEGSISLWRWIGPYSLLFLILPLVIKGNRSKRYLMLLAAIPLAMPYFQQTDLLGLMVLPIGWLAILGGNISYSYVLFDYAGLQFTFIVPLGLYLYGLLTLKRGVSRDLIGNDQTAEAA